MPKTMMLVLALLMSTAWLTAQEYPQTGSSQTGTEASGQTTVQGCLQGSNGSYALMAGRRRENSGHGRKLRIAWRPRQGQ